MYIQLYNMNIVRVYKYLIDLLLLLNNYRLIRCTIKIKLSRLIVRNQQIL